MIVSGSRLSVIRYNILESFLCKFIREAACHLRLSRESARCTCARRPRSEQKGNAVHGAAVHEALLELTRG